MWTVPFCQGMLSREGLGRSVEGPCRTVSMLLYSTIERSYAVAFPPSIHPCAAVLGWQFLFGRVSWRSVSGLSRLDTKLQRCNRPPATNARTVDAR